MAGEILYIKSENSIILFPDAIKEVNDYYRNIEPDPESVRYRALFDQVELDNCKCIMHSALKKNKINNTPETTNELNLSTTMVALQKKSIADKRIYPDYRKETEQIEKFRLNISNSYKDYNPVGLVSGFQRASIILSETLAGIQKNTYNPSPPKQIYRGV